MLIEPVVCEDKFNPKEYENRRHSTLLFRLFQQLFTAFAAKMAKAAAGKTRYVAAAPLFQYE